MLGQTDQRVDSDWQAGWYVRIGTTQQHGAGGKIDSSGKASGKGPRSGSGEADDWYAVRQYIEYAG